MSWTPTQEDITWTHNLYSGLNENGIWVLSSRGKDEPVSPTAHATFKKENGTMKLTDVHIENFDEHEKLFTRIEQAKICFEKLGIPCFTENTVETAFVDMISKHYSEESK